MREQASTIALFAALVLSASSAYARPAKRSHKTASHTVSSVAARRHDKAPARERTKPIVAAAPVADEPPIHVRHNRKTHLAKDAAEHDTAPRKLTSDDFMSAAARPAAPADRLPVAPAEDRPVKVVVASAAPAITVRKTGTAKPRIVVKAPAEELIAPPAITPVLYTKRGRLIVPPALKGSHEILLHQNEMADREGLDRVQDDDDLERLRGGKLLVGIPVSAGLEVDERLPANRRYCRPWTAQFLAALGRAHYARFHTALQLNSAVRTVEFQERLRYTNGNAAPAEGETASPHLTGQAVDLAKHGLSMTEIAWLRGYLLPLVQEGKVDVEEEFQQACFHISVYKRYVPEAVPKRVIERHRAAATVLAAAVR
jgi:hypothetical protein